MKTIQLQHIGRVKATEAINIFVGCKLVWNFGEISEVIEIVGETAKSIIIKEKSKSGNIYQRRFNKTRLVAIANA